jgi:hypothetical protein
MTFEIKLLPDTINSEDELFGEITIGDYQEKFASSLKLWSVDEYRRQWRSALKEIIEGVGKSQSALITLAGDVQSNISITCWPLYRDGDVVYVQNRFLFADDLPRSFKVEDIRDYIGERTKYSDEGDQISEWKVPLGDIQAFYEKTEG